MAEAAIEHISSLGVSPLAALKPEQLRGVQLPPLYLELLEICLAQVIRKKAHGSTELEPRLVRIDLGMLRGEMWRYIHSDDGQGKRFDVLCKERYVSPPTLRTAGPNYLTPIAFQHVVERLVKEKMVPNGFRYSFEPRPQRHKSSPKGTVLVLNWIYQ